MNRRALLLTAVIAALGLAACHHSKTMNNGQIKSTLNEDEVHKNYIEVLGIGAPDPTSTSDAQKKYTSREAALIDAHAKLVEIVKGLNMEGVGTASKAMLVDQQLTEKIEGAIRGATVITTEWDNQDGCIVTVHLDKSTLKKLDDRFQL